MLVLGRVMTGEGGDVILSTAGEVLREEFPELAERIRFHMPGEKEKRHGQAIAAASLPAIPEPRREVRESMQFHNAERRHLRPRWRRRRRRRWRAPRTCASPRTRTTSRSWPTTASPSASAGQDQWFTGVVVTNGAGSPRAGIYGDYTDEEMQKVRLRSSARRPIVGEYACQIQLGYTSAQVKDRDQTRRSWRT